MTVANETLVMAWTFVSDCSRIPVSASRSPARRYHRYNFCRSVSGTSRPRVVVSDGLGESGTAAIGTECGVHAHDCTKAWDWRRQVR